MKIRSFLPCLMVGGFLLSGAAGCARMSQATPKLSAELGSRIAEMRGLHELTLRRFFDGERQRIEDFLDREWTPHFLRNFLGTSNLLNDIAAAGFVSERDQGAIQTAIARFLRDTTEAPRATREIVAVVTRTRSAEPAAVRPVLQRFVEDARVDAATTHVSALLRSEDPAILVLEWAEDAQEQINIMRRQMLDPVNEAERMATSEVAEAYAQMAQANGAITGRLEAAAKVTEQQDALLKSFGIDSAAGKIRQRLAGISGAVGSALSAARNGLQDGKGATEIRKILDDALRARVGEAVRANP
jgi:hypothetical protein